MPESTLTVLFTQRVGALDRIISLLRRRGFPISSMTVERTHLPEIGRMTVVVKAPEAVSQVTRHLSRLPDVVDVAAGDEEAVRREYALVRIRCAPQQRPEVVALLSAFDARVLSISAEHLLLEAAGHGAELDALFAELAPYGIEESARTNPICMRRFPATDRLEVAGSLETQPA
jgi:acetolactate synthase-1/3 small subunit